MLNINREVNGIDEGWLQLILEAKEMGLSVEIVQDFLNQRRQITN